MRRCRWPAQLLLLPPRSRELRLPLRPPLRPPLRRPLRPLHTLRRPQAGPAAARGWPLPQLRYPLLLLRPRVWALQWCPRLLLSHRAWALHLRSPPPWPSARAGRRQRPLLSLLSLVLLLLRPRVWALRRCPRLLLSHRAWALHVRGPLRSTSAIASVGPSRPAAVDGQASTSGWGGLASGPLRKKKNVRVAKGGIDCRSLAPCCWLVVTAVVCCVRT